MNKLFKYLLCSCLLLFAFIAYADNEEFPKPQTPPRLVNDFAHMLEEGQEDLLEEKLLTYERESSTQITIVTITDLQGYEVADYAVNLFNQWKPGQEAKNNGVLILVSRDDRKMNITTGYGLEGALPDAISARIIRNEMTPAFKQNQYYQGFSKAADAIIAATKGEYQAEEPLDRVEPKSLIRNALLWSAIIFILIIFLSRNNRGGGGGGYMSKRGYRRWSGSGPVIWGGPLIGGWGSGGSFGGGSGGFGGGGFGGFGGGSSGGGGASGSW